MSLLLAGLGYSSVETHSDKVVVTDHAAYELQDTSIGVLDLIAVSDESLDNVFGIVFDVTTGTLTGFYDADSLAGSLDLQTYEIELSEDVGEVTPENLDASIGGFIA